MFKLLVTSIIIINNLLPPVSPTCRYPFEGFGVHLGKLESFNETSADVRASIINLVYNDLLIRNFRTEYLPQFSTKENTYSINCSDVKSCAWITMHSLLSKLPDKSVIVSIWSPPYYMKTFFRHLATEYEEAYYYYITNVTQLIKDQFNLTIDRISMANEPENLIASWDECTMPANQLCRLAQTYDDPIISLCPENAWFSVSKIYLNYSYHGINCRRACRTVVSHGYTLSLNPLFWGSVYYDTKEYPEDVESPTWITEISSTRILAQYSQMTEAIDFSTSIINFVGITCVQRFYYWLAFTTFPSGESLIWYDVTRNKIVLPKKYYALRHFTMASFDNSGHRFICSTNSYLCLQFTSKTVYVNKGYDKEQINNLCDLCCTTDDHDYRCTASNVLPPRSICSC
uniref:Glucosylceramidase n=1 Tax=Tetranychus urticae TaxID=32264 RepID=T1K012_TETUR